MQNREVAKQFFAEERTKDILNTQCCDCDAPNPQWASVTLGSYICLVCCGTHRSLGVHISFVRSLTMDSWSDRQLESMKHGGNRKLKEYLVRHGVSSAASIQEKYGSKAAEAYRQRLKATVDGLPLPPDPALGTGAEPFYDTPAQRPLDSAPIMGGPIPQQESAGAGVQEKVTEGLWSAWEAAKKAAEAARETAQNTVEHAQEQGWVDSVKTLAGDSASYVKSSATTAATWSAEKATTGYNYVKESEVGKTVEQRLAEMRGQNAANASMGNSKPSQNTGMNQNTPPTGGTTPLRMESPPPLGNTPPKVLTPTLTSPPAEKKDLWEDDDW